MRLTFSKEGGAANLAFHLLHLHLRLTDRQAKVSFFLPLSLPPCLVVHCMARPVRHMCSINDPLGLEKVATGLETIHLYLKGSSSDAINRYFHQTTSNM